MTWTGGNHMPSKPTRQQGVRPSKGQVSSQLTLERVLGFTLTNNCALSLDQASGVLAYAAGCVIVLRPLEHDRQQFIQIPSKKSITAVEFSPDGKFLATGESGHQPMVRLWSVADHCQLAEFAGHHFRVVAVRFSPSAQYLVSLGSQEDNTLYLWDRMNGQRVASAKVTNKVNGIAFSPTGQFFVTVGIRHIRYWYLETKRCKSRETLPLSGRNAVLGELLNNNFMDVCCVLSTTAEQSTSSSLPNHTKTQGSTGDSVHEPNSVLTLVVSRAGQLMQFNEQRYLDKWVELRTPRASCLAAHGSCVIVGCSRGTSLLFDAESLQFLAQIPLPHKLGSEAHLLPTRLSPLSDSPPSDESVDNTQLPDLMAVRLDCTHSCVVCCYSDHSLYIWDISDLSNIRRSASYFYHSRGVWSVDCLTEEISSPLRKSAVDTPYASIVGDHAPSWWGKDMFVTCADDGTIRFWDVVDEGGDATVENGGGRMSASFSEDYGFNRKSGGRVKERLSRIIYTDQSYKYLCVSDRIPVGVGPVGGPPCPPGALTPGQGDSTAPSPSSPTIPNSGDFIQGSPFTQDGGGCCVRTVCISPDCQHLAAGDRGGNLRVYSLENLEQVCHIAAHDSEILSLNFFRSDSVPELALLCSASRDRLIHIFDPNQGYSLVQTVADHSAAIFAARIIETEEDGEIRLISCGMDKSLLIRVLEPDDAGLTAHFALEHHLVGRHSQLDAAFTPFRSQTLDSRSCSPRKRYLAVACQDRRLRIYNITTGRPVRCYRGSFNEDGCLLRCTIDPTGSIVATSGSDKQMNIFHLLTGESIATLFGHSEIALGLRFLPSLTHLVTVSSDSCIFIWRLSSSLTKLLRDRTGSARRTSSCSGFHSASSILSSTNSGYNSLRLPRSFRNRSDRSAAEDPVTTNWDDSAIAKTLEDYEADSECDLSQLDTEELLPTDPCSPQHISHFGSNVDLLGTNDVSARRADRNCESVPPCGTAKNKTASSSRKPAFYFSVSALPAWARRKLSRRSSVAMVPPSTSQFSSALPETEPTNRGPEEVSSVSSESVSPHITPHDQDTSEGNAESTTTSSQNQLSARKESSDKRLDTIGSPRSVFGSASSRQQGQILSNSEYYSSSLRSNTVTHVIDSRSFRSRAGRSALSRDNSPRGDMSSASGKSFGRIERASVEYENSRRSLRQPKRSNTLVPSSTMTTSTTAHQTNLRSSSLRAPIHRYVCDRDHQTDTVADDIQGLTKIKGLANPIPSEEPSHSRSSLRSSSILSRSSRIPGTTHYKSTTELTSASSGSIAGFSPASSRHPSGSCSMTVISDVDHLAITKTQSPRRESTGSRPQVMFTLSNFAPPTLKDIEERSPSCPSPGPSSCAKRPSGLLFQRRSKPASECSSPSVLSPTANRGPPNDTLLDRSYAASTFCSQQRAAVQNAKESNTSNQKTVVSSSGGLKRSSSDVSKGGCAPINRPVLTSNCVSEVNYVKGSSHNLAAVAEHSLDSYASAEVGIPRTVSQTPLSPTSVYARSPTTRARWLPVSDQSPPVSGFKDISSSESVRMPSELKKASRPTNLIITHSLARANGRSAVSTETVSQQENNVSEANSTDKPSSLNQHSPRPRKSSTCLVNSLIPADSFSTATTTTTNAEEEQGEEEEDRVSSTHEALEAVGDALDRAVKRCREFKSSNFSPEDLANVRSIVANQLEWRFSQLRALLGLAPICVEAPVARVLLADLVERLIPELRLLSGPNLVDTHSLHQDRAVGNRLPAAAESKSHIPAAGSFEWVADSTTGSGSPHTDSKTNAENQNHDQRLCDTRISRASISLKQEESPEN
ncbi:unnamed protein product [Calicophoron daubneyi]|uniref:MABP1/WDR62 second WD40 domain-containing protein n=1 Tax=Calicophoron daubneyi TaxID=300641 RepID=A0AAV2T730_CALDB